MSVDTGIINLFLHPPIGLQRLESIGDIVWTGAGNFTRPRVVVPIGQVGVDAFGIRWQISTFPPGYGFIAGPRALVFDRTVLQLAIQHLLIDGAETTTQDADIRVGLGHILFEESYPASVHWILSPGVGARFWWMVRPLST